MNQNRWITVINKNQKSKAIRKRGIVYPRMLLS